MIIGAKKVRPDSSDTSGLVPRTIPVLKRGFNHTFIFYPSHAAQSGSVAAAAISPLSTDSVLM